MDDSHDRRVPGSTAAPRERGGGERGNLVLVDNWFQANSSPRWIVDRSRIASRRGPPRTATTFERECAAWPPCIAEDLKHDRKVAIKVLKPELAAVLGAEAVRPSR